MCAFCKNWQLCLNSDQTTSRRWNLTELVDLRENSPCKGSQIRFDATQNLKFNAEFFIFRPWPVSIEHLRWVVLLPLLCTCVQIYCVCADVICYMTNETLLTTEINCSTWSLCVAMQWFSLGSHSFWARYAMLFCLKFIYGLVWGKQVVLLVGL